MFKCVPVSDLRIHLTTKALNDAYYLPETCGFKNSIFTKTLFYN